MTQGSPPKTNKKRTESDQSQRFINSARDLGCDDSEEAFDEALRKVARHKGKDEKPPRSPKPKG